MLNARVRRAEAVGEAKLAVVATERAGAVTEEEFAALTVEYIAATEARLAYIKGDRPTTTDALNTYRELADQEWELGLAWDAELLRIIEED